MMNNTVLLAIDKNYIETLTESLDGKGLPDKDRPYYVEVSIFRNYKVFVPLRSNCGGSQYYVPILNDNKAKRKRPGLDCNKMIIIKNSDAPFITSVLNKPINNKVFADINMKATKIRAKCISLLNDYNKIIEKQNQNMLLNKKEQQILSSSTLKNYKKLISNLDQNLL